MSEPRPERRFFSLREVAGQIGCDVSKIRRWVARGHLTAVDLGTDPGSTKRRIFVEAAELDRFIRSRTVAPAAPLPPRRRRSGSPEYV